MSVRFFTSFLIILWLMTLIPLPGSAGENGQQDPINGAAGEASGTVGSDGSVSGSTGNTSGTVGSDGSVSGSTGNTSGTVGSDGSVSGNAGGTSGTVGSDGSVSGTTGGTTGSTTPTTPEVPVAVTPPTPEEMVEQWQENPFEFLAGPFELVTASVNVFDPMRENEILSLEQTLEARFEPAVRHILIDLSMGGSEAYYEQILSTRLSTDGERERGTLSRETRLWATLARETGASERDARRKLKDQLRNVDDQADEVMRREMVLRPLLPEMIAQVQASKRAGERDRDRLEEAAIVGRALKAGSDAQLPEGEIERLALRMQEVMTVILDETDRTDVTDRDILNTALADSDQVLNQAANRKSSAEAYSRQLQAANDLIPTRGYSQTQEVEFTRRALRTEMVPERAAKELVESWRHNITERALMLWKAGWRVHTLDHFKKMQIGTQWVLFYKDRPATGFEADLVKVEK